MLNLILKDFKVTKKINIILFVYSLFISFMAIKSEAKHPGALYIMSLVLIVYLSIMYANGYDEKYKIHASLNSMPINKKSIVEAKYLSIIIYLSFYSIVIFIASNIFGLIFNLKSNAASIWDFVICFNGITIFYAVYYPFYYKIEKEKLKAFNFVMYMIVLIIPSIFTKFMKTNSGQSFLREISKISNVNIVHLIFLLIALVLLIISLEISMRIYSRKEFY